MLDYEEWRTIEIFKGFYEVSNKGNVRRYSKLINLKPGKTKRGYLYVSTCVNGFILNRFIHRLVAITFLSNPNNKPQVNHIDGDKTNNNVLNLEWCTQSENIKHSYLILNRKGVNKDKLGKENKSSKPIKQLTLNGDLIKKWDCINDYERETGKRASDISAVLNGRQKTAHGYKWSLS